MHNQIIIPTRKKAVEHNDGSLGGWHGKNALIVSSNNGRGKILRSDDPNETNQIDIIEPIKNKKDAIDFTKEDVVCIRSDIGNNVDDDIGKQLTNWVQNANNLIQTNEFQNFTASTQSIVTATTGKLFHIATLPITLPIHITLFTTMSICHHVSNAFGALFISDLSSHDSKEVLQQEEGANEMAIVTKEEENLSLGQNSMKQNDPLDELMDGAMPFLFQVVGDVQHHVGSAVSSVFHGIFGGGNDDDNSRCNSEQKFDEKLLNRDGSNTKDGSFEHRSISNQEKDYDDKMVKDTKARQMTAVSSSSSSVMVDTRNSKDVSTNDQQQHQCTSYYIRVGDLDLPSSSDYFEENISNQKCLSLIHDSQQQGKYQENSAFVHTIDALVQDALFLATTTTTHSPPNRLLPVNWKPEGYTKKWLGQHQQPDGQNYSDSWISLLGKEVLKWSGRIQHNHHYSTPPSKQHYNADIPIFKAQGIINNASPKDLKDLLLDSNRVGEYNQYCLGRTEEVTFQEEESDGRLMTTKIVRSETKVPFTGKTIVLRNLLHAQTVVQEKECSVINDGGVGGGYILISRSASIDNPNKENNNNNNAKNEIVWGVNLIQSIPNDPNKAMLTTLSQVKSSLVPGFMAHKIGLMGMDDFFKNLRNVVSSV